MKKAVTTLLLLVIILATFAFVILRLQAQGSEDNFFNTKWREKFAASPMMRKILGLHFDGDAKADFLSSRYQKIVIEVDWMADHEMPNSSLELLREKMESITGKEVQIVESDEIPFRENLSQDHIDKIVEQYRNVTFVKNSASIYLLYVSMQDGELDHLGSTYQEYGVIVFDTALRNFTEKNPDTFANYVASTALHEFGHQIGLPHNDIEGCLLNEHAEESHVARERPQDVIIDFCDYEKELIEKKRLDY